MDIYYYLALIPIFATIILTAGSGIIYGTFLKVIPVILVGSTAIVGTVQFKAQVEETQIPLECSENFYSNLVLLQGDTKEAIDLILEDIELNGENSSNITSLARAKALSNDFVASKGLYQKAEILSENDKSFPTKEYESVRDKINIVSDENFINFIETEWADYDYSELGLKTSTEKVLSYDEINEMISENIADDIDDIISNESREQADYYEELVEAFETVGDIDLYYEELLNNKYKENEETTKQIEKHIENIEDIIEKSKDFKKFDFLKLKLVKGLIIINRPEEVVDILIDGNISDKILLSELYLKGFINDKNFSNKHLEKLQEADIESDDILDQLKENIDNTEEEIDKSELAEIYFQKAKIDFTLGDTESADSNIEEALENAEVSSNVDLSQNLIAIKDYLENDNFEDIDRIEAVENASKSIAQIEIPATYEEEIDFSQELQNYVSMKQASITISRIDAEDFKTISARFSVNSDIADTAEELKSLIKVYDCGDEITDFTLERIDFANAYTILLSDTSGSMKDSIVDLQNAVIAFAKEMDGTEYVSVATFSDGIDSQDAFTTNSVDVFKSAQNIVLNGGTNIYGSILSVLEAFPSSRDNISNTIIVMTDGMEYNRTAKNEIYATLSSLCIEKNIDIYTLGLGTELDSQYLSNIARACGGKYMNITDSVSLNEFYVFLHQQLNNQYTITYEAKNEYLNTRDLNISLEVTSEQDTKSYTLYNEFAYDDTYSDIFNVDQEGISVSNIDTNIIYKGAEDTKILLYGNGFEANNDIVINLEGTTPQTVEGKYLSSNVIEFYVPHTSEMGLYSLSVYIDGHCFNLKNVLSILEAGRETVFRFGEYIYVATYITQGNGYANLGGNVVMNNWLDFNGAIKIYGDKETDYSLSVEDLYGSKVILTQENSVGLASVLANWGLQVPMPAFNEHTITRVNDNIADKNYDEDYKPAEVKNITLTIPFVATASVGGELYHDHIEFKVSGKLIPFFPEQDKVIKVQDSTFEVSSSREIAIYIHPQRIGLNIDFDSSVSLDDSSKDSYFAVIPILPETFKIKIDTLRNDFYLNLKVGLKHMPSLKPSVEINIENGQWEKAMLGVDKEIAFTIGYVPASVSDFKIGLTDMNAEILDGSLSEVLSSSRLTGAMEFSIAKVKAIVPFLGEIFGDASLISIKDITLKAPSFKQLSLDLSARAVLFGAFEVASAEVSIGEMSYSSAILGENSVDTAGLRVLQNRGIDLDYEAFGVYVNGANETIASTNYVGTQVAGDVDMYIDFFMKKRLSGQGDFSFGYYKYNNDKYQLTILARVNGENVRYDWSANNSVSF